MENNKPRRYQEQILFFHHATICADIGIECLTTCMPKDPKTSETTLLLGSEKRCMSGCISMKL